MSAAWIRNSEQYLDKKEIVSVEAVVSEENSRVELVS